MAISYTVKNFDGYPQSVGSKLECVAKLTLSGTYETGGSPIEAVPFGLKYFEFMALGYEVRQWAEFGLGDPIEANPLPIMWIMLQNTFDGAEVTNGQDLTGDEYVVYVRGF